MTDKEFVTINNLDTLGLTRGEKKFLKRAMGARALIRCKGMFFWADEGNRVQRVVKA
jgi:hypothetical protein